MGNLTLKSLAIKAKKGSSNKYTEGTFLATVVGVLVEVPVMVSLVAVVNRTRYLFES